MKQLECTPEEIAGIKAVNNGIWVCTTKRHLIKEFDNDEPTQKDCQENSGDTCRLGGQCVPKINKQYVVVKDRMEYVNGVSITELRRRIK
jgi:hypothetical protein